MTAQREGGLLEEGLTQSVIGAFFEVYGALGYGFREFIYVRALERELLTKGHKVDREVAVMVYYRGDPLARQKLDMIVDALRPRTAIPSRRFRKSTEAPPTVIPPSPYLRSSRCPAVHPLHPFIPLHPSFSSLWPA